ncbi:MAG TPA: hypothetical protein VGV18_03235 [Verrucomicrobiae bacterium]|nr:hypothetical protein [Verrucomicrobiae bacterium]
MKNINSKSLLALLLAFNLRPSVLFSQGNLTPPGPPGATMLTLSQVEPRTPISSVPITITQPGSYYLVSNLVCTVSNAIVITANGVTLDLNGFTLSSTVANAANGGAAVLLNTALSISDITICNGHIVSGVTNNGSNVYSGSGFSYGIFYSGFSPVNVLVSHVTVSGCLDYGIYVYNEIGSTLVGSCTVSTIGNYGIAAYKVNQSSAIDCAEVAIYADQVSDCMGQSTFHGYGLYAQYTASGCSGASYSGTGLDAFIASVCHGTSSLGTALTATHNVNSY